MVLTELKCLKTGHLIHDHLFEYSTISSRETSACLRWLSDDFHNKLRNKNGVYFLPGGLFECCILRMKILMFLKPCFFRLNNRIDRKEANKSIFQWQKKSHSRECLVSLYLSVWICLRFVQDCRLYYRRSYYGNFLATNAKLS